MNEEEIKKALDSLSWTDLQDQLDKTILDIESLQQVLGHVRRCGALICRRHNAKRQSRRDDLLRDMETFVGARLGVEAARLVEAEAMLLRQIENGYQGILDRLAHSDTAPLDPSARVSGLFWHIVDGYRELHSMYERQLRHSDQITHLFRLRGPQGQSFNIDGALTAMVEIATMTLKMEAYNNGWFNKDRRLVLPTFLSEDAELKKLASITEVLAMCWRGWERTEERRRFCGGTLREVSRDKYATVLPDKITKVLEYQPLDTVDNPTEFLDYVANERLNDRLAQTFVDMMMMTKLPIIGKGIENAIGLPPGNFVSSQEAHSAVSLSEMVSYDIATAEDRPGGLRLVEWLRGYATLQVIADNAAKENAANQFVRLSCDELKSILHRVGLTTEAASCFIDRATLHERSWDLFDQPLIEMADGSYLLFGPAVHTANPARIVLSAIANLSVQLSRKGSAFENDIRSFLKKQPGLEVHNFTATRNNEPFEYDVIVIWGDYLFVLECKNESLSGHKPVQGYYYSLGVRSHVKQVKRLVTALEVYPDILLNSVGPHAVGKTIVPCVVSALPFSIPEGIDGVHFTDASVLKRFFESKYFRIIVPHQISKKMKVIHRVAMKSIWKGDKPAPEDLLHQFEDPFQVEVILKHTELKQAVFPLGEETACVTSDYGRTEETVSSLADITGVNAAWVKKEIKKVRRASFDAKREAERRLLRQQDRAARKRRELERRREID